MATGGENRAMPGNPEVYLHGHHDSVLRSHRWRTAENSAAYLLPRLSSRDRVLDVGCGPGTITVGLAKLVPQGSVLGIDQAEDVLAEARAEATRLGQANVSFEAGDVYRLRFDDGAFDAVHAHQVLQHLANPVAAIREMRRVCRQGGTVALRDVDFGGMFWAPEDAEMEEWRQLYQQVARAVGGEPDAGRHLLGWAHEAGFEQVELSGGFWCFATAEERSWWCGLWADRLTQSRFADQALTRQLASLESLNRLADGLRRWAASTDGCFFVPHGQALCTR